MSDLRDVPAVRRALQKAIRQGKLTTPGEIAIADGLLILDVDDHVSDEAVGGGRVRIVVALTPADTAALGQALPKGSKR